MNGQTQEQVVVVVTTVLYQRKDGTNYAARIVPLGLTGYGNTPDAAVRKVKRMFHSAVQAHRQCGDLVAWLDQSKLQWAWRSKYTGKLPIEDAIAGGTSHVGNDWKQLEHLEMPFSMAA